MRVQAPLTSAIGHVLTGSITLRAMPVGPVEIVMHTSATAPPKGGASAFGDDAD
jgi:hypothetical protein